jgi:ABC-type multidrug transport system fused ATPase/permease subunit
MPDMAKAKVAGANIYEIIESEDEHQLAIAQGGVSKDPIQGAIEFRDVSFKYPSREKEVFRGLSFQVTLGQKIGLVGSSGCGKSTIMQLILRFYDIDSGLILIDGKSIKDYDLYHLREAFGIVTQEPVLFAGSIKENIKYKHTEATLEQVK